MQIPRKPVPSRKAPNSAFESAELPPSDALASPSSRRHWHRPIAVVLNEYLPPHKSYVGLSRRNLLFVVLAIGLALLALIIGLSVGLTLRAR